MKAEQTGRLSLTLAGIVLGFLALLMTGAGLLFLWSLAFGVPPSTPQPGSSRPSGQAYAIVALIFVTFGTSLAVIAWRLVANRPRPDGGLFSPTALRFASLIFVAGWAVSLVRHPVFGLAEAVSLWSAAAGCFALARHRESYLRGETRRLQPTEETERH